MIEESSEDLVGLDSGFQKSTIDDKGRLLFGKQIRAYTGNSFVLNYGEVGQLEAYSIEEWRSLMKSLGEFDRFGSSGKMYQRLRYGRHILVKLDPQGRVVLPSEFRDLANIKKEVFILGALNCVEIWAPDEYLEAERDPLNYKKARRDSIDLALAATRKTGVMIDGAGGQ
jgi:MraZ protein